ncbi:MAG TPA: TetR/AcrR family transcriptional regulator [Papillibacter sp.]|jgi:AcrR family transcriptional regulator|nr:TetR/AcrR family transcriptional regulator [Papillibacter sp.]
MSKRDYIIQKCFDCFVKNGIEGTTTRDFCAEADVNANTLYYYFASKNDILIECVNFGFSQLENALFDALKEFDKSSFDIFPRLTKIGMDFAPQMRFLYQAVSSPAYEEYRDDQFKRVNAFWERLGKELARRFECPYELIKDHIYEIMTLLSYYTLWGSQDMAAIQFNRIFTDFKDAVQSYRRLKDVN